MRTGRVVQLEGKRAVIQVFEGTRGISLTNTRTRLRGRPMELALSPEILGRVFDGAGRPIDGLGGYFSPEEDEYQRYADESGLPCLSEKLYQYRYFQY